MEQSSRIVVLDELNRHLRKVQAGAAGLCDGEEESNVVAGFRYILDEMIDYIEDEVIPTLSGE